MSNFLNAIQVILGAFTENCLQFVKEFWYGILLPFVGWYFKRSRGKKKYIQCPKDPINSTQLELQSQVQGYIEDMLRDLKADRVLIHKFHNGGKYHTGVSTQKMKLVYEASKRRGRRIKNELAGDCFLLEKMGGILKKVVDKKYLYLIICRDRDVFGMTPYFQILEDDDVYANHLSILRSNGKWRNIGVLSIHWFESKKSLTAKEAMRIQDAQTHMSLLLVGDTKGYPANQI
tara:strand:- start:351 stop:1046 length:696 start_codon:yes stop_codon:yes gene_type:complete